MCRLVLGSNALKTTQPKVNNVDVSFLDALRNGGLVSDGAMGSLLYERGVFVNRNFDECNISQPELVARIHQEYIVAGANVCETNTYGANRLRLARHGLANRTEDLNRAGVALLRQAAHDTAYIAGSMGPTGMHMQEVHAQVAEVRRAYAEQAKILADAGCDLLCIETFHDPFELRCAIESARSVTTLPILACITPEPHAQMAVGHDLKALGRAMHDWGADAIGANCSSPQEILDLATGLLSAGLPVCAMPNAGHPETIEDRQIYLATPENFGVFARRLYKAGVKLVGGCCGTGPAHIRRVAAAARMIAPRLEMLEKIHVDEVSVGHAPKPLAERSQFGAMLGKRFVVSVEVNPLEGIDVDKPIEAARMLLRAGADVINIADGPRASARMSNLALAVRMQQALGNEVLLHMCCRDHNLLGLQALILGANVLDVHNVVVITGDPPKIGDFPDAMAVYDTDAIGLLAMLDGFNRGIDPSGKKTAQTSFVCATGVEPGALDFSREIARLRRKVQAGANLIMTQPVYDPAHLERFLEATRDLDVPVLVGLLPLASHKNAEFVHHNIPGMRIPHEVRERMRQAGKGDDARQVGVDIAFETLMGIRERVAGAYIMPPLGRYHMAAAILERLGNDRSLSVSTPGVQLHP